VDAHILAKLLRADLVSTVHIPAKETRQRKEVLRQRCFFVRQRTMVRNRIQRLLGGLHGIALPAVTDLFGKKGMAALEALELPAPAGLLLTQQLEMLRTLQLRIKEDEAALSGLMESVPGYALVQTLPGMGPVLAAVVVSEVDAISRFGTAQKFSGYAGLCPRTSSSGGKTHHGELFSACNKWLRWALIEASWVAVGCSPYFGDLYRRRRAGGKLANVAITCVARRMARILWQMLTNRRAFTKLPPQAKNPEPEEAGGHRPAAPSVSEDEDSGREPPPSLGAEAGRTVKHFPSRSGRGLAGLRG
jgi:transposase